LVASGGELDVEDYSQRLAEKFGKSSPYEGKATDPDNWPEHMKNPVDAQGNPIKEQEKWSKPLPGPWRHGSIKDFLTNYVTNGKRFPECGGPDEQADGCCKVAPLVALYAGAPDLLPLVDKAVRVTQNTDIAAGFACAFARVLEKLVLGAVSTDEAVLKTVSELQDPDRSFKTPADATVVDNISKIFEEFSGKSPSAVGVILAGKKPEGPSKWKSYDGLA